jgi:hypothetical protein
MRYFVIAVGGEDLTNNDTPEEIVNQLNYALDVAEIERGHKERSGLTLEAIGEVSSLAVNQYLAELAERSTEKRCAEFDMVWDCPCCE